MSNSNGMTNGWVTFNVVACIMNSLPEKLNNARTAIGIREEVTLKEAKAIIESVQDLLKNNNFSQRNYRAAVVTFSLTSETRPTSAT